MYAGITSAELGIGGALMVALCGFIVVFIMLAALWLVIVVISKIVNAIESKKPAPAPVKQAPPPAAAPKPAPAAPVQDDAELAAVIMAAIAEETGNPMGSFQVTSVRPVTAAAPAPAPAAAPAPAPAPVPAAPAPAAVSAGETAVRSPMPGSVLKVECKAGQSVSAGDTLVVLEAMKMEIEVAAPAAGTVKSVSASVGSAVNTDDLLVTLG